MGLSCNPVAKGKASNSLLCLLKVRTILFGICDIVLLLFRRTQTHTPPRTHTKNPFPSKGNFHKIKLATQFDQIAYRGKLGDQQRERPKGNNTRTRVIERPRTFPNRPRLPYIADVIVRGGSSLFILYTAFFSHPREAGALAQ